MSWQSGPRGMRAPRPLGPMMGAVFMASQKPLAEAALAEMHKVMANVPADIDWAGFQAGVARYAAQNEPVPERVYRVMGQEGRVTLLDAGGEGVPVVLVPSLVNRGYVLDLYPGHSLVEALRAQGFRVLLVDWGDPVAGDAPLPLEVLIAGRLVPLLRRAAGELGPMAVFGYCMGGLLALGAAVLLGPGVVSRLAVGAMPWDFSVTPSSGHMLLARPVMEPWLQAQALVPAEVMQQYFWLLDPWTPVRRMIAYGQAEEGGHLGFLTALEDWLTDGLALDGPVAREMLLEWYADNRTVHGNWRVAGEVIAPERLAMPVWCAVTQRDTLVPAMCSLAFAARAKNVVIHMADTGHVGLVCGRRAAEQLYGPLGGWLRGTGNQEPGTGT